MMKRQLPEGYTVKYEHQRYRLDEVQDLIETYWDSPPQQVKEAQDYLRLLITYDEKRAQKGNISPTGGITYAHVFNGDGVEVEMGKARCSVLDNFDKKIARDMALGRALKEMERRSQLA